MVEELLTQQQCDLIVDIIKARCGRFKTFENQYGDLFYEPYTRMRHKHTVTSAIISGFAPGCFDIAGITSADLSYGLCDKMSQPELSCEKGVFHIYSDSSDLKGKKIVERCKSMNLDITKPPLFFLLVVYVSSKGDLKKIELCLPNKDASIRERYVMFEN